MTKEEIHNIYLHMSGKAEGIAEATGAADFPVLFANAILEYAKRPWQGLTDEEIESAISDGFARGLDDGNVPNRDVIHYVRVIEAALKEKNSA